VACEYYAASLRGIYQIFGRVKPNTVLANVSMDGARIPSLGKNSEILYSGSNDGLWIVGKKWGKAKGECKFEDNY
jgi:hypothetical protein